MNSLCFLIHVYCTHMYTCTFDCTRTHTCIHVHLTISLTSVSTLPYTFTMYMYNIHVQVYTYMSRAPFYDALLTCVQCTCTGIYMYMPLGHYGMYIVHVCTTVYVILHLCSLWEFHSLVIYTQQLQWLGHTVHTMPPEA